MLYEIFRGTIDQCLDKLNGTLVLGPFQRDRGLPVGGKTLIFTQPSATTVTFSGSGGSYLSMETIRSDIAAQLAAANPKLRGYAYTTHSGDTFKAVDPGVVLTMQNDTNGISISEIGTANADFNLSVAEATTTVPVATGDIISFAADKKLGLYVLVIAPWR